MGLHDGKKNLLPEDIKRSLLRGDITDFVALKDIPVNGRRINIDAKLSLREKGDGTKALLVHPIYAKTQNHPLLSKEENDIFQRKGTHAKKTAAYGTITDFGKAPYKFEDGGRQSFFVRLQKADGRQTEVWGTDLERAMAESRKTVGEKAQLELKATGTGGNAWEIKDYEEGKKHEKTLLFEYDEETKSFVGVDSESITVPETVNGQHLTPEQKREFREGKAVAFPDGTAIQASPKEKNMLRSNRKFLIASVLLDGGTSFLLYQALKALFKGGKQEKQKEKESYSKGYMDAVNKVRVDLQRKQQRYPNDREIARDLSIVDGELAKATVALATAGKVPGIGQVLEKANDPELDDNALRREREGALQKPGEDEEQEQRTGYRR